MIDNTELSLKYGDGPIRVSSIYWLALCNDGMSLPDEIKDDFGEREWRQAFGDEHEYLPDFDDIDDFCQALIDQGLFGLLAHIEIQIPCSATANGYMTHGWGYYQTRWVYAETPDELLSKLDEAKQLYFDPKVAALREKLKQGAEI